MIGRYKNHGDGAIHLKDVINGKEHEFVYEEEFRKQTTDNAFIPRLWATRRVGYLLDELREHDDKEVRDEVIALGTEFGIVTPYTSYLVLENDQAYRQHNIPRNANTTPSSPIPEPMPRQDAPASSSRVFADQAGGEGFRTPARLLRDAEDLDYARKMRREESVAKQSVHPQTSAPDTGSRGVDYSVAIQDYKETIVTMPTRVKQVNQRLFEFIDDTWVDRSYKESMTTKKLSYASDAYFDYLTKHPSLNSYFALGERVIIVIDDHTAVRITP